MFKPCPNCGFLVALIAGREASQRCPRCGSVLVTEAEALDLAADAVPQRHRSDAATPAPEGTAAPRHDDAPRQASAPAGLARGRYADAAAGTSAEAPVSASASASASAASTGDDPAPDRDAPIGGAPVVDATDADADPSPDAALQPGTPAAHDGPSFVRRRARTPRSPGRRWPWLLVLPLLAALLALQLLLAQRAELARDAGWRPLVLGACGVLGCDVPAWHAPREYAMVARGVRPDPRHPGVLHVSASLRNDARWPQPAPVVVLSLSDVDGRLVGARAVGPRDYGRRADTLVAPGDSLDIAFDVREPAGHVESFDFQLQ